MFNKIILISGFARSGKDTLANALVNRLGFKKFAFADKVKEVAQALDIKMSVNGFEFITSYWNGHDSTKRFPCIEIGHKLRRILGDDIWVNALRADEKFQQAVANNDDIVISDNRYGNEFNIVPPNYKLYSFYIVRESAFPQGAEEVSIGELLAEGKSITIANTADSAEEFAQFGLDIVKQHLAFTDSLAKSYF